MLESNILKKPYRVSGKAFFLHIWRIPDLLSNKKDGHSTALLIFELPASSPRTSRAYFLVLTVLYHDKIKMHVTKGSAFTLRAEGGVFSVKWYIFLVLVVIPIDRESIKCFKKALKRRLKYMLDQFLRWFVA